MQPPNMLSVSDSELSPQPAVPEDAGAPAQPEDRWSDRLLALDAISQGLMEGVRELRELAGLPGIVFLAGFLTAKNIEKLLRRELPSLDALDRFTPTEPRKSLRLLPRGVVCHWIAGNVPLLGTFSWSISAVLGNRNLVRLSSRQQDFLSPLLTFLRGTSPAGRALAERTSVLTFDRDDLEAHRQMSEAADVRIAWGGQDAVQTVRNLPCKWECEDILLGPRNSIAVIDPEAATASSTSRLAADIVYFDQLACSSPQILFAKGAPTQPHFAKFVDHLVDALVAQSRRFPRHPLDPAETYRIQVDRGRILLSGGELRRDSHTQWTLALVDAPRSDVTCTNRFVQLVPFHDFTAVLRFLPQRLQSVVTLLSAEDHAEFTERAAFSGACRFPVPGAGNHFELPWDGLPVVSKLLRWVVRTDPK